ncbi:hypothetical protein H9Q08_12700 [Chryseobacterium sp. PS-8]|uniref:Uncharacterized protein n=1 Tax=Chryseobacterium indicum TaxID=2766954 RepID=A0ABS9C6H6_9FLAO|nr:hypothetical protein [Chryseobacterium sp. PS-8]MCF2220161.1 hypothetical protein [Chryseobacterium sp. PS-8]
MRNLFKIMFVITLLFSFQSNAQLDTISYLKQFEINKAQYIGQPFSKLLQNMTQIQPKTVWSLPLRNNTTLVRITSFKFCEKKYSFYNAITLKITWDIDIPIAQTNALGVTHQYYFTNDEKTFYGNKIIKDIRVYRR